MTIPNYRYTVSPRYKSHYDLPVIDILTLLFESEHTRTRDDDKVHIDATEPSRFLTKTQVRNLTERIAYGLRHQFAVGSSGPGKDVVVVFCTGQISLPSLFYGTVAADGIYSAASPGSTASELARLMKEAEPRVLISSPDLKETAVAAAKLCQIPLTRVLILASVPEPSLTSLDDGRSCLSSNRLTWRRITDRQELEDGVIGLLYSSGTTGPPKGVCLSHMNMLAGGLLPVLVWREWRAALDMAGTFPPQEFRGLAHLPAAHVAGATSYFLSTMLYGGEVYWMQNFDWLKFLEYNKRYRITYWFSVPPIFLMILKSDLVTDQFDSLDFAMTGAAPMGKELQIAVTKRLGRGECFVGQSWGLTETTGPVTSAHFEQRDETGSLSPPLPNTQVRILDDNGRDITAQDGIPGEIIVKGPQVVKGYFRNEQATRETFTADGWLKTGDIGYLRNGLLYLVDRKKELIKYKGQQVAPSEIEAHLTSHPLIADAGVIGIEGDGTELPRAYVVADPKKISKEEIQQYVKEHLAAYKQLRGGVVFVPSIPRSPAGKILRRDLKAMAAKGLKPHL